MTTDDTVLMIIMLTMSFMTTILLAQLRLSFDYFFTMIIGTFIVFVLLGCFAVPETKDFFVSSNIEIEKSNKGDSHKIIIKDKEISKNRIIYPNNLKRILIKSNDVSNLNFYVKIKASFSPFSFIELNENDFLSITYPRDYICFDYNSFRLEHRYKLDNHDISEISHKNLNSSFVAIKGIKQMNSETTELTFKKNEYELFSLYYKKSDYIRIEQSNRNHISGDIYVSANNVLPNKCFKQNIKIEIKDKEEYKKIKSLLNK